MRLLVLVTDAYGGRGGIAEFNRNLLVALSEHPQCSEIVAIPRRVVDPVGTLPPKLRYEVPSSGSKGRYFVRLIRALSRRGFDGIVCAHINLLPLAALAARWTGKPLLLVGYGIDVWRPTPSRLANRLARDVDHAVLISEITRDRFLAWSGLPRERTTVIPCCVDLAAFHPGPKREDLLQRLGIEGREVIMTLGRLATEERYKGFDEVLDVLPSLIAERPRLTYVIAGDGCDRVRLEAKAAALGVRDYVVFTGYLPESEKADYYRLADAYVMPGRGEGFGIVILEALACGIPVVASTADGSREAVRGGKLGALVDPDDPGSVRGGILEALARPKGRFPDGLAYFDEEQFRRRWTDLVDAALGLPVRYADDENSSRRKPSDTRQSLASRRER